MSSFLSCNTYSRKLKLDAVENFWLYRAFSSSGISVRNRDKAETIILSHDWSFNVT